MMVVKEDRGVFMQIELMDSVAVQDFSLAQFLQDQSKELSSDSQVCKRQEAIWELFTSECVYFLDQLMVLKEVTFHSDAHNTNTKQTKPK